MSFILIASSNAFSMCDDVALKVATNYVSAGLNVDESTLLATIVEDNFNETYGRGDYLVKVTNKSETLSNEVYIDMVAYDTDDEFGVVCEEDSVRIN